jgi:uncharacterized membrane protein
MSVSNNIEPSKTTIKIHEELGELSKRADQRLTTAEKVAKWVIKILVMIAGVITGAALGALLTPVFVVPYLGAGIGGGLAFLATIKALEVVEEYFKEMGTQRELASHQLPPSEELSISA